MKKELGVLCPLFSLPNEFGIGDFSETAYKFIDFIDEIGFSYWQLLPLNPIDSSHSPYCSISSFAIDDIYISIPNLVKRGYISSYEPYSLKKFNRVNYSRARKYKNKYLQIAFNNFLRKEGAEMRLEMFKIQEPWVVKYASYVVLKEKNHYRPWNQWKKHTLEIDEYDYSLNFEVFKQYLLTEQWNEVHTYALKKGIRIIGDLPFYVGYDSADVYYERESFILKSDNTPKLIAGVPPDYFSADGQLWGNPIYDWNYLKENDYKLIVDRIVHASKIYDIVRLDHFRAFDTYYTIDANASNARVGAWLETPSYDFFDYLLSRRENLSFIAEDLGYLREEVFTLRDHYNIPGMQVIQFSIIEEELEHKFLKHIYKRENSVVYLSTHDNETTMQWFSKLPKDRQEWLQSYLKGRFGSHHIITNLFNYAASQPANVVILAIWDILRLGKNGRLNEPGSVSNNNWSFRLLNYEKIYAQKRHLTKLSNESHRNKNNE